MIIGYISFFALGLITFFLMAKFGLPIRIAIALVVFLTPSIALTVWVAHVGDEAPPDAITVVPQQKNGSKEEKIGSDQSRIN